MTILEKLFPSEIGQWLTTIGFCGFVLLVLITVELIHRAFFFEREITRKIVHFVVSILIILFSFYLESPQPLVFTALIFSLVNIIIIYFNFFPSIHTDRKTYGIVFYSITVFFLSLFLLPEHHFIFVNVMLILSISDPSAALIGQGLKNIHPYRSFIDSKSLEGSVTMGVTTFIILLISFYFFNYQNDDKSILILIIFLIIITLLITISESFSAFGSDNLSIAITASVLLYIFLNAQNEIIVQFITAFFFSIFFLGFSIYFKFLKPSGAFAAVFLAIFIYGTGQWLWTIPILVFFISSSLISKIGKSKKKEAELLYEKSSQRDSRQVFANGGISLFLALLFLFFENDFFFYAYLVSVASANADTWATEIGALSRVRPILITNFRTVEKGRSGGISLLGSTASLFGALIIAVTGKILYPEISIMMILLITISGFAGSLIDSLFGATIQAQYKSKETNKITEKKNNLLYSGFFWINNDMVNLLSITAAVIFFGLLNLL